MRYWGREYRSGAGTGRECVSGFCRGFVRYATSEWDESTGPSKSISGHVNRYFIEAPDNGLKPSNAEGAYQDASACHCILFDENGNVTKDRAELRVRQEFDKALQALANGKPALAAFYAGALAHYTGDLGQFYHIMGSQSHWGAEDQTRHGASK